MGRHDNAIAIKKIMVIVYGVVVGVVRSSLVITCFRSGHDTKTQSEAS